MICFKKKKNKKPKTLNKATYKSVYLGLWFQMAEVRHGHNKNRKPRAGKQRE